MALTYCGFIPSKNSIVVHTRFFMFSFSYWRQKKKFYGVKPGDPSFKCCLTIALYCVLLIVFIKMILYCYIFLHYDLILFTCYSCIVLSTILIL